ncbi:D-alanine--D-alanine ligase A [Staphylococcus pseudintermedius]|nr:D-alanine--D-alanine ligase A [Staphylococcus pseudintermedius]
MNRKINIMLLFGGRSTENEISIKSARNIYNNMDKEKYNITLTYIDTNGNWYPIIDINDIQSNEIITEHIKIFENIDLTFPIIHGNSGEDGSIHGFLETIGAKYIGSGILSSAICLDKSVTKAILASQNIPVVDSILFKKGVSNVYKMINKIDEILGFPVFIKPCNQGSSVGVNKSKNIKELKEHLAIALNYDNKILIEKSIDGREVEIGILGNDKIITSCIGEVILDDDFYTFESKYNKNTTLKIPASLEKDQEKRIKNLAVKAFQALECKGLARIDFLIDKQNNIYINEVNTIPGFTDSSMFPKLFHKDGYSQNELIDNIIKESL